MNIFVTLKMQHGQTPLNNFTIEVGNGIQRFTKREKKLDVIITTTFLRSWMQEGTVLIILSATLETAERQAIVLVKNQANHVLLQRNVISNWLVCQIQFGHMQRNVPLWSMLEDFVKKITIVSKDCSVGIQQSLIFISTRNAWRNLHYRMALSLDIEKLLSMTMAKIWYETGLRVQAELLVGLVFLTRVFALQLTILSQMVMTMIL